MGMPTRRELLKRHHPDKGFSTPGVAIAGLRWQTVDGRVYTAPVKPGLLTVDGETIVILSESEVPATLLSYYQKHDEPVTMGVLYLYATGQLKASPVDVNCKTVVRCVSTEEAVRGERLMVSWNRRGVDGPELVSKALFVEWDRGLPHNQTYAGLGHDGGDLVVRYQAQTKTLLCPSTSTTPFQAVIQVETIDEALNGFDITVAVPTVGKFRHHVPGVCEPGTSRELRLGDRRMWLKFEL